MSQEKLIDLAVGKGLEAGLYPSADPTSGPVWSGGQNIWFRDLTIEQVLGRQKILNLVGSSSKALTQAFNSPNKSLYYENAGTIYQLNGTGNPTVFGVPSIVGSLTPGSDPWLEPWGTWLIMTDGVTQPSIWQGASPISIGVGQFKTAQIIKKLAQFAIAYNLDTGNNGFAWSRLSDPTQWTPPAPPGFQSEAGNLTIRDLDSGIVAVADLAGSHAVYSQNTMLPVTFVGFQNGWFGTPNQAISGIGAVSKRSVVTVGQFNFGITRTGIFTTDGTTATWLDRPVIDKWLQEDVNWSQANQIWGYWNGKMQVVVWVVPLNPTSIYYTVANPRIALIMDPKTRTVTSESVYLSRKVFSFADSLQLGGLEQEVFDYPFSIQSDGLYYESVPNTLQGSFNLTTQLFDGGESSFYKLWDYAIFKGTFDLTDTTMQVRFGHTDTPTLASIQWDAWQPMQNFCPPVAGPRESIYLAIGFRGASTFKLTAITIYGEKGGLVN